MYRFGEYSTERAVIPIACWASLLHFRLLSIQLNQHHFLIVCRPPPTPHWINWILLHAHHCPALPLCLPHRPSALIGQCIPSIFSYKNIYIKKACHGVCHCHRIVCHHRVLCHICCHLCHHRVHRHHHPSSCACAGFQDLIALECFLLNENGVMVQAKIWEAIKGLGPLCSDGILLLGLTMEPPKHLGYNYQSMGEGQSHETYPMGGHIHEVLCKFFRVSMPGTTSQESCGSMWTLWHSSGCNVKSNGLLGYPGQIVAKIQGWMKHKYFWMFKNVINIQKYL